MSATTTTTTIIPFRLTSNGTPALMTAMTFSKNSSDVHYNPLTTDVGPHVHCLHVEDVVGAHIKVKKCCRCEIEYPEDSSWKT